MHVQRFGFALVICAFVLFAHADEPKIEFEKVRLSDRFHSEAAGAGDFNRDGARDVVSGPFWYEGPDFQTRNTYARPEDPVDPREYSKFMGAYVDDFDGDSWFDIVIIGFPGEAATWYGNPRGEVLDRWTPHLMLDGVDNESPAYANLVGNARRELVCTHDGQLGYAQRDPTDPTKPWSFHPLSEKKPEYQRFTHGLGVGDVNGDGRNDVIAKDGWWEQPESLAGDPTWKHHAVNFGDGGAQMYAVDVNGDDRPDVITSLSAHGYGIAWFEQKSPDEFVKHLITREKSPATSTAATSVSSDDDKMVSFSQPHALAIADIDGDGLTDIIAGKRYWAHGPNHDAEPNAPAVLYWFQCKRSTDGAVEFIPHRIDDDSGVGTQVVATDINGDKLVDILVGNKKGTFVFFQKRTP